METPSPPGPPIPPVPPALLPPPLTTFSFKVGDRIYHVSRDTRRGNGFMIVANGDLVEYVSTLHYGEVGAFTRIAQRLEDIESDWAKISGLQTPALFDPRSNP